MSDICAQLRVDHHSTVVIRAFTLTLPGWGLFPLAVTKKANERRMLV
jgi:hypothetical protein